MTLLPLSAARRSGVIFGMEPKQLTRGFPPFPHEKFGLFRREESIRSVLEQV
jgi:hypothetical protein